MPSDRAVATRTQFRVTYPSGAVPSAALLAGDSPASPPALPDLRGWSSPHGEPYRPLGKPDLALKFAPRLADGSSLLQNAQRMRVFEGSKPHHSGSSGGQGSKNKEVREATGTGGRDALQDKPALFDLFPFNVGSSRKRALDERQVRFAYRLQESVVNYSPEKIRGLQRRPGGNSPTRFERHRDDAQAPSGVEDSFEMLKEALQECSSRLRQVRNGSCLLRQLPSNSLSMLHELQDEYLKERERALESRAARSSASRVGSAHSGRPIPTSSSADRGVVGGRIAGTSAQSPSPPLGVEEERCYLPYTTRQLQHSPHRHLPSLDELRVQVREEKQQVPARPLRKSYDATGQPLNRRPSGRPSRIFSTIAGGARPSVLGDTGSSTLNRPSQPGDDSDVGSPHRSLHAYGTGTTSTASLGKREERIGTEPKLQRPSPTKLHNIERLQAAVNAMDEVKTRQSALLAQSIESLNQDRRDCLAIKFKSFNVEHHVDDDLISMRKRSEMQRIRQIEQTVESVHWYEELLRKLLAREGTASPPHPAELFLVKAIRQLAHEGHEFTIPLLFELLERIHANDFAVKEVQDTLLFLRDELVVPPDTWASFFGDHGFQLPVEPNDRREAEPEPRTNRLGSKLRAVVKASQLLRHLSTKG